VNTFRLQENEDVIIWKLKKTVFLWNLCTMLWLKIMLDLSTKEFGRVKPLKRYNSLCGWWPMMPC
jgi:hypothetical protein